MLSTIKQRLGRDDEQGFTLIELMVVVLIIAILLAIAIPTFLGARNSANARGAQSNLRNALTAEQSYWTNNQQFSATGMSAIEPAINWVTASVTSAGGNTVTVQAITKSATNDTVFLEAYSKDGNCYTVEQTNDPSVTGGSNTGYSISKPASGACSLGTPTWSLPTAGSAAAGTAGTFYTTW